ncbi:MAG TPA: hypothetical protein VGB03_04240, partial [Acidimicrobiales bacterium]
MTDEADTGAPRVPLVCELVCGETLDRHVEEFRTWAALVWDLTVEALLSSGVIERSDDVYDKALWDGVVGTGLVPDTKLRTRRLSAKAWTEMLGGDDLRGFGVSARPLPHVPEATGAESYISLSSNWHPDTHIPNWTSWTLPARFTVGVDSAWVSRLVAGFVAFGVATRAHAGLIGWVKTTTLFLTYPLARTDYESVLWQPGWAVLLSDGHM